MRSRAIEWMYLAAQRRHAGGWPEGVTVWPSRVDGYAGRSLAYEWLAGQYELAMLGQAQ